MTNLYTISGSAPSKLPFRITLSDGRVRTDPSTFTEEEILDAGYELAPEKPSPDEAHNVLWVDGSWVQVPIPAPTTTYKNLDSASLISLFESAGGMTPSQVVACKNDPSMEYFWVLLQISPYTSRENQKLPFALEAMASLGYLPNGAQAVLDAWPTE